MTRTITNRIGTQSYHRDYPDILTCLKAMPRDLVLNDVCIVLELYNDSAFAVTAFGVTGFNTDANHTITVRPALGHGYRDNATASTPLTLDQTKGVLISKSGGAPSFVYLAQDYLTFDGFQIDSSDPGGSTVYHDLSKLVTLSNCMIRGTSNYSPVIQGSANLKSVNNLVIQSNTGPGIADTGSATYIDCTVVCTTTGNGARGLYGNYAAPLVIGCAAFGFGGRSFTGTYASGSDYNVSDGTSPGAHSLGNKVFANQFVSTTTDFRVKTGADLIGAGAVNSAAPTDMLHQPRSGSAPTAGAYEYGSSIPVVTRPADPTPPTMHVTGKLICNGSPVVNATKLRWAWYDDLTYKPTDSGVAGTTDSSGNYSFLLVNTLAGIGGTGFLRITDSVGTPDSSTTRSFFGKKTVTS